jgi:hypothetical protein
MRQRLDLHYRLGCNGSGVARMTHLGYQTARKIARIANCACSLDPTVSANPPLHDRSLPAIARGQGHSCLDRQCRLHHRDLCKMHAINSEDRRNGIQGRQRRWRSASFCDLCQNRRQDRRSAVTDITQSAKGTPSSGGSDRCHPVRSLRAPPRQHRDINRPALCCARLPPVAFDIAPKRRVSPVQQLR